MKAIRAHEFGTAEVLQLDEIAEPVAGQHNIIIDVKAIGVNPADTYMLGGAYAIKPELRISRAVTLQVLSALWEQPSTLGSTVSDIPPFTATSR